MNINCCILRCFIFFACNVEKELLLRLLRLNAEALSKSMKMCLNIMIMSRRTFICTKAGRFLKRRQIIKMKILAFIAAASAEYCYVCTSTKRIVKDTFNDERPSMSTDLDDCWKLRREIAYFSWFPFQNYDLVIDPQTKNKPTVNLVVITFSMRIDFATSVRIGWMSSTG